MIRRLLPVLTLWLGIVLSAACSKEDTPAPRIEISAARIALPGTAGSTVSVSVTATAAWEAVCTGSGFEADLTAGEKGTSRITLTATLDNNGRSRRTLGRMTLRLKSGTVSDAAEKTLEVLQKPATASQTMLLYMPGRSLLSYYQKNIESIRQAVSATVPGNGRILVCYQPKSYTQASLVEISYDLATDGCTVETLKTYDEFSPASPEDLSEMFSDLAEYAPARSYGLMIGCHGKAWIPAREGILSDEIPFAAGKQPTGAGHLSASDDLWHPLPGAKPTRSFGDSRREMDIPIFASVVEALPYRFDYLIFDACFMASVEMLYDLRHAFDYIIASPCEILAAGFPYGRIVPYLFTGEGTSYDLERVCHEFWNFYQNDWESVPENEQSGCISLCVTAQLDGTDSNPGLADVVRRLYASPQQAVDVNTLQSYEGMTTHVFYDLGHYIRSAYTDAALLDEFRERLDAAFPPSCRLNTAAFYSAYNDRMNPILDGAYSGVSTSEPSTRYRESYTQTAWYQATH